MSSSQARPVENGFDDFEPGEIEPAAKRGGAASERWSRIPILPDSYCLMFFGKRGSGKSAVMAKCGKDEAELGKPVWYWPADYSFKYGEPIDLRTLYSLPEFLQNGALLIDEVQNFANALRSMSTANIMAGSMLQQIRKRGLNVYGTSNAPRRIDRTIAAQTSFHYYCSMVKDPRCDIRGYHMISCDDHVVARWTDTNGEYGVDKWHKDGRKRGNVVFWKIRDMYKVYNTEAIADVAEALSITKDDIVQARAGRDAGIQTEDLVISLRDVWIPWAVNQAGWRTLTPANFTMGINERYQLKISVNQMVMALKTLGLQSKHNGEARIITLPPKTNLDDWRRGGWSPA